MLTWNVEQQAVCRGPKVMIYVAARALLRKADSAMIITYSSRFDLVIRNNRVKKKKKTQVLAIFCWLSTRHR